MKKVARRRSERGSRKTGDTPLSEKVENSQLVIRIGIERLAWCAIRDGLSPFRGWKVTDAAVLAQEVANEMHRDSGDGNTPLNDFLDKMMQAAVDNGSVGLVRKKFLRNFARAARNSKPSTRKARSGGMV